MGGISQNSNFFELILDSQYFPTLALKLSLNLSATHLRAKIACYELKGDLSPVMLNKEIFHDSFIENFKIYKDLYGRPCKLDWMAKVVFLIQMLLIFGGLCNRYF